jgi:hypothetical protein
VISARQQDVPALRELAGELPLDQLGTVGGTGIAIGDAILPLSEAAEIFENALPAALKEPIT